MVGIALAFAVYSPGRVLQLFCPFPLEPAPGKWHLRWTDEKRLLAVCRDVIRDRKNHGVYGEEPLSRSVRRARRGPTWVGDISALPSEIRSLSPVFAIVSDREVTLVWGEQWAFPYGYGLTLLAEGNDGADLRRRDGSFCRNVELSEGIWSVYWFH